jgi:uncharacterized protein (TIGR02246 family)
MPLRRFWIVPLAAGFVVAGVILVVQIGSRFGIAPLVAVAERARGLRPGRRNMRRDRRNGTAESSGAAAAADAGPFFMPATPRIVTDPDADVAARDEAEADTEAARTAIARVNAVYLDALVHADAATFASTFDDEGLVLPAAGAAIRGRTAIERAMIGRFADLCFLEAGMSQTDLMLSGELAIETGVFRYLVIRQANGSPKRVGGRYAFVWRRVRGEWRIALDTVHPGALA